MAQNPVTSRATLISHCKRALGDGVVDINVTDNQVDDCFDDEIHENYEVDCDVYCTIGLS